MSEIRVRRRHGLRLPQAMRLAETMARRLRDDFGGSYVWDGDTLRFRRTGVSGHIAVTPDDFEIRVTLSFLLGPLHGRIEREILTFCDARAGQAAPDQAQAATPAARRSRSTRSSRSHGASRSERPK